jgi:hypothetical protein
VAFLVKDHKFCRVASFTVYHLAMINQQEYIDSLLVALAGTVERLNDLQRQTDMAKTHNAFSSRVNDELKMAEVSKLRSDLYLMTGRAELAEQETVKLRKEVEHKDHQILELKSKLNGDAYRDQIGPTELQKQLDRIYPAADPFDMNDSF